jgi:hypothetical protein
VRDFEIDIASTFWEITFKSHVNNVTYMMTYTYHVVNASTRKHKITNPVVAGLILERCVISTRKFIWDSLSSHPGKLVRCINRRDIIRRVLTSPQKTENGP